MKQYLIDNKLNWYRANMHCHTTNSDGSLSPAEVKELYKKQGYSIIAYTDHEVLLDNSFLNDENFLAITSTEYSLIDNKPTLEKFVPRDNMDLRFRKVFHFNLYAKDPKNTFQIACSPDYLNDHQKQLKGEVKTDNFKREYSVKCANEMIKRANKAGFLVQYNHPYWSMNDRTEYLKLKGLWSFEILNYCTDLENGCEEHPDIYDDMLHNGMKLYCSMGDDNHNRAWNGGVEWGCFGGSTIIGADELRYDKIMKSLETGNFYCTRGINPPLIKKLYVEDNKIYVECSKAEEIFCTGMSRNVQRTVGTNITKTVFNLEPCEIYFRITVKDKYNNKAYTHAYFIEDLSK